MSLRSNKYFRVGRMRERITIQSAHVDESSGQPLRTWRDLYPDQPAHYVPVNGGETVSGRQVEAGIRAVFTLHVRDGITPEMQVIHGDQVYGIGYVHQLGDHPFYVQLHCRSVERNQEYTEDDA